MPRRKSNSPWGSAYKEGLPSTAVNDRIEVDEILYPSVNTGAIDVASGQWEGVTLNDKIFTIDATHESVANGGSVLSPQATPDYIDMTNYSDLFIALNASVAGNYRLRAKIGPATNAFANLAPADAGVTIRMISSTQSSFADAVNDAVEVLTADVWNIFAIQGRLKDQKVLQFEIQNNSGSAANIIFAYLRAV